MENVHFQAPTPEWTQMVTGGPGIYRRAPIQAGVATTACTYLMLQDTFMKFKSQHYIFQILLFS